ncbi:MAG: hypothetical protein EOO43_05940, partial [Flavobacterium sp.]
NRYSNTSYNLNYKYVLDTLGQQLDVDMALLNYKNEEEVLFKNSFFDDNDNPGNKNTIFRNISPTDLKIKAITINYTLPMSNTSAIGLGIKSSQVNTDNDFLVENQLGTDWYKDLEQSNRFIYQERINAAYINFKKELLGFDIQLGARAEQTSTYGNSVNMSETFRRKYLDLFPVFSLSKKLDMNHTLGLSANRRIDRPNYGSLNPFIYFLDLYTYKRGNQNLKPQYTNSLAFNYLLHQKYALEIVYSNTKDVISDIIRPDATRGALFTTPDNLARQKSISISLSVPISVSNFWNMYNDLSAYHIKYYSNDILGATYRSDQIAMNFKSYSTFIITKGLNFDVSFFYQSKQLYGTSYLEAFSFMDVGTSYKFFNNRLNLKLSLKDIFDQKKQILSSNLPNVNYHLYDKPETRLFAIGLSYSIGGKDVKQARKRSIGIEDEKGRIGGLR